MPPLSRLARAKRELQPLEQGDLDSLCGLYAVINAVRLVVYPDHILTPDMLAQLFERGLGTLSHKRKLKRTLANGMTTSLWQPMCLVVVAEAEKLLGCAISVGHLSGAVRRWQTQDVIAGINRCLRSDQPVLVCLEGRLNHWSVIATAGAIRLSLFDSAGYRWILTSSISATDRHWRPHQIRPDCAVALQLVRKRV